MSDHHKPKKEGGKGVICCLTFLPWGLVLYSEKIEGKKKKGEEKDFTYLPLIFGIAPY